MNEWRLKLISDYMRYCGSYSRFQRVCRAVDVTSVTFAESLSLPGTIVNVSLGLSHPILRADLRVECYCYRLFTNGKTEAQRSLVSLPKVTQLGRVELRFKSWLQAQSQGFLTVLTHTFSLLFKSVIEIKS